MFTILQVKTFFSFCLNFSTSSTVANFSVTLPMPKRKHTPAAQGDLDPLRSNSMQSIRDEIIDGLQKMSSSVDMLKRGVS